jgi:hypothetical protein
MDGESPAPLGVVGREAEAVGSGKKAEGMEWLQIERIWNNPRMIPVEFHSF